MKQKILIMAGYYIPSVKGGGPIQSIRNIVDNLSDKYNFLIVAADRDLGDNQPFENIDVDKWVQVGKANVYYTDVSKLNWRKTKMIIDDSQCKIMYLNSFFDYKFSIVPIVLNNINKINVDKIIIAPRGQFSPGALNLKKYKKRAFIETVKLMRLFKNVIWHATANSEKEYIQSIFGDEISIIVANNLTGNYNDLTYCKNLKKTRGELKVVFVSRIHPKKNLKQAIDLLQSVNGDIILSIYGPIEDSQYWEECKLKISLLPSNIKVDYHGIVNHDEIINIFNNHHVFLFPTLGENYGHVISEALIGGCPVIISDQTPWRGLEETRIGWDISLNNRQKYVSVLNEIMEMDDIEYKVLSMNAYSYGLESSKREDVLSIYRKIFG